MARKPKPNMYWATHPNPRFAPDLRVLSWDVVPVARHQRIAVEVIGDDTGDLRAGADLTVFAGKGSITCGNACGRNVWLWSRGAETLNDPTQARLYAQATGQPNATVGSRFICDVEAPEGLLTVRRVVWRPPASNPATIFTETSYSGALLEDRGTTRVYRWNLGSRTDGFDRFVFSLELL